MTSPRPQKTEVAIVGSGPGGAVTACVLAERGLDVVLLEEGGWLPQDSSCLFSLDELATKYRSGGLTVAFGSPRINYAEGRCVGGGSEINSGLYHRTPAEKLAEWTEEFGVRDLDEQSLRPHFEACEQELAPRLREGPAPGAAARFREAAGRLGWQANEPARACRYGQPDSEGFPVYSRSSMTETFLPRALRSGLRLLADSRVERVRESGAAWRLDCRAGSGERFQIGADAVFLCAGAVQTPALLQRSGILRGAASGLGVHPMVKVVARFREAVNHVGMGVPAEQAFDPAFRRVSFGCSISSRPFLALGLMDHPEARKLLGGEWRRLANYYVSLSPQGRGSVRTVPGLRDPIVRYELTDDDLGTLSSGLRDLSRLLFAAGAVELFPSIAGFGSLSTERDLARIPAVLPRDRTGLTAVHLFCSCPMGERPDVCTTDSYGRVFGAKNLHVSDASVLCSVPGLNPQGTIMALARRNAVRFAEER